MPTEAPTLGRLLTWHPQPIPLFDLICVLAGSVYLVAVFDLRGRGHAWPVGRTLSFVAGLLTIIASTGTGIGGYGMELFSVHMVQHMLLSMLAPILLLMGAPITLALRSLPSSGNARKRLLAVLHSRVARWLTSPLVTIPLFLASLYGLYFTPLLDVVMSHWIGHQWMLAHFLVVGLLFFFPIMGIDPGPRRHTYPMRMVELLATMPFHAFFGIALMSGTTQMSTTFATAHPGWNISPLSDQSTGGGIAWAFTELPSLIVLVIVFINWSRSEERAGRAYNRKADRDGDVELNDYNDYLASLQKQR